jgi:hypothetical protein
MSRVITRLQHGDDSLTTVIAFGAFGEWSKYFVRWHGHRSDVTGHQVLE